MDIADLPPQDPDSNGCTVSINDNLIQHIIVLEYRILVTATGSEVELIELGEVFAWLSAACRSSSDRGIAYCSPYISSNTNTPSCCVISCAFDTVARPPVDSGQDNTCWLKIFNNPTIAKGYPIRLREQGEPGLEIPLNMAAVLGYAQFATSFDGRFLLKGPCSAFVPKLRQGPSVIWHYLINENQDPMTYDQALGEYAEAPELDLFPLEASRHFIGWTPKAQILTGEYLYSLPDGPHWPLL